MKNTFCKYLMKSMSIIVNCFPLDTGTFNYLIKSKCYDADYRVLFLLFSTYRETPECLAACQELGADPKDVNDSLKANRKVRAKFGLTEEQYSHFMAEEDPIVSLMVFLGFPVAKRVRI